ncbi:MAG: trigger factor [Candidatus Korobacteraceae bacterium]
MNSTEDSKNQSPNPCQREVSVEIPADVVEKEEQSVISEFQKHARVPGFRRGKVPAAIIRQRFSQDIKSELVEHLVPRYFRQETEKQHLVPVSQPQVTDIDLAGGKPMRFKASFEVLPEIDVTGYQEIRPEKNEISVTDEEVEQALGNLRERHATYENVEEERPLQDGDYAQAGFSGTSQEADAKPMNVDDVLVEIGGSATMKEFSDNLRGAKAGEERRFDVTYPQDFSDKRLAGKTIHYEVKIKSIKRKSTPELTDGFAKEVGSEFESLEDLKTRIRESIQTGKQQEEEHRAKDKLVQDLVTKFDIAVPESMVEQQIDTRLERGLRALAAQGMRTEDLKRMDLGSLREGQRQAARREVQASLLLDKIADLETVEVSDEELDKEIESLSKQMQQTVEVVRKRLEENGSVDRIRARIRNDKTLEMLYGRAG